MTISSIVNKHRAHKAPFCTSDVSVFDAAVEIAELGVNALAVVDDDHLAGIITDHDIIRALADSGSDLEAVNVREWMTPKVVTCTPDHSLSQVLTLLARYGIRHIVVVEGDKPVAVVGAREILSVIHENDEMQVKVLRDLAMAAQAAQLA